jgi:ABC-type amino acid transport substrate-binding protein
MTIRNEQLKSIGERGKARLAMISRLKPFIDAMETEPWKEIFDSDLEQLSSTFNRIYESLINNGSAEQKDVIKLQILDEKLKKIYEKWETYNKCITDIP